MKKEFFITFLLSATMIFAQQKQPKVGLVLSGGGAKGFAHVGVLKEIDKAGLQIDYIGGTSMGAVDWRPLYAIGYSGEQIEKIVVRDRLCFICSETNCQEAPPLLLKKNSEKKRFLHCLFQKVK